MGRWRPPQPASSPYITAEGFDALQAELKVLWLRRRDVVKALSAAAAEGDRSENAEYIYRKKELGGLDRRIRYIQKRLPDLKVVREFPNKAQVFFGAWIRLEKENGDQVEYRIVGPDETDSSKGFISLDSPMARAALGKRTDDEIKVDLGGSEEAMAIIDIRYE